MASFYEKDDNRAGFNVCKTIISSKCDNTGNVLKQLSMQHGLKFQECTSLHKSDAASQTSGMSATSGKYSVISGINRLFI